MSSHSMITRAEIFQVEIPLLKPFETSFGVISARPFLIIRIEDSLGNIGYGEASLLHVPISETEIISDGFSLLSNKLPEILSQSCVAFDEIDLALAPLIGFPITRTGVEGALLHLFAQRNNVSLQSIFGGTRDSIMIGESVGIQDSVQQCCDEVARYVERGYSRVKIKIKPGFDISFIDGVRARFPKLVLAVDANGAYLPEHIPFFLSLEKYELDYIEQPFSRDDLVSHATLAHALKTPICLDESVYDFFSCVAAIDAGACDVINIKPARVGGYLAAKKIHDYCFERHIPLFGGGRLESGIGRIFNAHLFSLPGFVLPSDMSDALEYFLDDFIVPSFASKHGMFRIPLDKGLGVNICDDKIRQYCTRHQDVLLDNSCML